MRAWGYVGLTSVGILAFASAAWSAPMLGFDEAGARDERALEAKFDAGLSPGAIRERLLRMSAEANEVGSPHDKANAEFTLAQFKAWGWDAHIETFNVLYPTPREQVLELLGPEPFKADLTEPPIPGDATTARTANVLPGYLAYGGEGDVTAPLIYVNYGMPADYLALQRMGLDVKGKIVIVRYGAGWRGLKPKLAYEHGAVGCIIYSDPADDGYGAGDPYPKGAYRPERGIQRGSVLDMPVQTGDPLTPNLGDTPGAPPLTMAQSKTLLHIPAMPIAYGDAQHFLAALTGPVAPPAWRGALPITYHVGGAGALTHLVVKSNWDQKPLYDVIAMLPGAKWPNQWVVRGNHRDGWVYGASDPLSGQTALMEEAKSLGALVKTGWRPARTIVYASWDGEEPGLLGSTDWAEAHGKELRSKAVLYINSDGNNRGFLSVDASYSTRRLVDEASADVRDPETGASVRDRAIAALRVRALAPKADEELKILAKAASDGEFPIADMGAGSDYSPFVQHLGITSIDLGYRGEGSSGGVYHSAYDTFEHFERFGDPGFVYGVALAETTGRLVMRTANADLLPLRFGNVADTIGLEVDQLRKLVAATREATNASNALLDAKAFAQAADPTQSWAPPERLDAVPAIDFGPLDAAVSKLRTSASAYDHAAARPGNDVAANTILQGAEQALTDSAGLPGRPWYRNLIYAPGLLTGYGAKTLPGVREAIESRRWSEATDYIARTAAVIDALSARLDAATRALGG